LPPENADIFKRMVSLIRRNAERMGSLVAKVAEEETTLQTSPNLEGLEVDVWPLVEGLVNDMSALAEPAGTAITNSIDNDVVVFADPVVLIEIFQNLLSNAIKYTQHGQVEVGAGVLDNGFVQCWVKDTGSGIPEERIGKVFDKFETDPDKRPRVGDC